MEFDRRDGQPIRWPTPTHGAPDSVEVRKGARLPWRTAAECIDWTIPCPSIFERDRLLKDATCRRIAAGVMRYVVNTARPFIVPVTNTGWNPDRLIDADAPLPTITTAKGGEMAVVSPLFARTAHGEQDRTGKKRGQGAHSAEEPFPTVTASRDSALTAASLFKLRRNSHGEDPAKPLGTVNAGGQHHGIAAATLIQMGYGERKGQQPRALDLHKPLGTAVAGGLKHAAVAAFMAQHNAGNGAAPKRMTEPMSTITGRGTQQQPVEVTMIEAGSLPPDLLERAQLVAAFLVKYYGSEVGQHQAVDVPIDTVTAKPRFAVVTVTIANDNGEPATYVLVDIGMRMLTPRELANAQGFPRDYVLDPECWYRTEKGNLKFGRLPLTHQIAKIGNSVCPDMSEALARANLPEHCTAIEKVAA